MMELTPQVLQIGVTKKESDARYIVGCGKDDYLCEEEMMYTCVKRRRCLFVRRGDDVYLCEEEEMCIFVKRRRCLCM